MTVLWADYVGYPGGAALAAAGFVGVVRYVGIGGSAKRLTAAEYQDLVGHGLKVLGVVESTTTEADKGYAAGVADARAAAADIAAVTGGRGLDFVFATNDKPGYVPADVDYVRGFRDVFGLARTGAYGFADFLSAVRQLGYASVFWQAGKPPSLTGTAGLAHFWQRQGTTGQIVAGAVVDGPANPTQITVAGVPVDINNQLRPLPELQPLPGGDIMGMSNGVFERGLNNHTLPLTTNSVSQVINKAWFSIRPAWGDLDAVRIVFQDDKGHALEDKTNPVLAVPDGTTGINVDWAKEAPVAGRADVAVGWAIEYTSK